MPRSTTWHAREMGDLTEVLDTDLDAGLTTAQAAARLDRHGPNELEQDEPRPDLEILLAQFASPLIFILLVAFVVTIVIEEYTDAGVIAAVLLINAVIGFTQERRADRSVHALMDLAAPRSVIVRDGSERDVASRDLVPGDIVLLTSGTRVPADLRLVRATSLEVDESLLTGESLPARKTTASVPAGALAVDRTNMAFMGSAVTRGRGRGVVTATAANTQLGAIAASIRQEQRPPTPLQQRMHRFANVVAVVVLTSTAIAFILGLALGGAVDDMFLTAVALAVAVVPEGLPVAFTVAMALGVRRMAHRNAIVRSLPAVETLGSTDVIGSDKTGTLTTNRMTVLRAWTASSAVDGTGGTGGFIAFGRSGSDQDVLGSDLPAAADVVANACDTRRVALVTSLRTAVLTNEADLILDGDTVIEHRGDPTESALLEAARSVGIGPTQLRDDTPVLATIPFESDRRYSYAIVDEQGPVLRLKGAPERVVELCTTLLDGEELRELDPDEVLRAADALANRGLRVLAMAELRLPVTVADIGMEQPPTPEGLVLTGLLGMQDPPRAGVGDAIARCRRAGIRVVMITGDHAATARAIARDLGITHRTGAVATGADVERMDDDALRQAVLHTDVFARVAPEHKLRIVHALQAHDQVVAVTGDGVNDGPALKAADIGIAMGRSGTDVAREASDMVLTDDNFVSIANAVEEGRVVFDNVRKVTYFLLSTGAASIIAIITAIATGLPLPYVPAALLWLNVVTNGLQDVALAFDSGEPGVLDRPPRRRDEGLVNGVLWERTALTGATMAAGSLWLFLWAIDAGLSRPQQRGASLTTLVIAMGAHVYNARSEHRSIVQSHVRDNPFLLIASILAVTIHVAASYWAPTQVVLQIEPVTPAGWARILIVALTVVAVSELHKSVRSRRRPSSSPPRPAADDLASPARHDAVRGVPR